VLALPDDAQIRCPICESPANLVEPSYPGYRERTTFGIAECAVCALSFAVPTIVDAALYDVIYSQRAVIPGYDRYDRYARSITRAKDPLAFLAEKEEHYWAVRKAVESLPVGAEVLDVGSGLGYLTYAFVRAGLRATGLDLSEEAIDRARSRFGNNYVAADFFAWSEQNPARYDLVVMLELIEHVEAPLLWLQSAMRLIKPGGRLLLSTPNRDFYVPGTIWETEAPPVHLWWFSAHSMRRIAKQVGVGLEIVDLTLCGIRPAPLPDGIVRTLRSPLIRRDGKSLASLLRRMLHRLGLLDAAIATHEWLATLRASASGMRADPARQDPARRETLVAILRNPT
jgi:SAM-dependent methyltransferase